MNLSIYLEEMLVDGAEIEWKDFRKFRQKIYKSIFYSIKFEFSVKFWTSRFLQSWRIRIAWEQKFRSISEKFLTIPYKVLVISLRTYSVSPIFKIQRTLKCHIISNTFKFWKSHGKLRFLYKTSTKKTSCLVLILCWIRKFISISKESGLKWTVLKVDGRAKVDGPSKSGRPWAKVDGHLSQSGRSWTKADGLLS